MGYSKIRKKQTLFGQKTEFRTEPTEAESMELCAE